MSARASIAMLALSAAGCFPTLEDAPWRVDEARILAVRGDPAEAAPLGVVSFEALVASPAGAIDDGAARWAFCLRGRNLEERNGVTRACLETEGEAIQPFGGRSASMIQDACARFGPNPPPAEPGVPPLRAADPDPTGGYFVPVQIQVPIEGRALVGIGLERVKCNLGSAPFEISQAFLREYAENDNPEIARLEVVESGGATRDAASLDTVSPGTELGLRLTWTSSSAEPYPYYDFGSTSLVDRIESMSVSWFTTHGAMERERTAMSEEEIRAGGTALENRWIAPAEPARAWIWAVLRDARGGVTWQEIELAVQ